LGEKKDWDGEEQDCGGDTGSHRLCVSIDRGTKDRRIGISDGRAALQPLV